MNYPNPHAPSSPWYNITEQFGPPNQKWCEETLSAWVSEPANTWSNIGYFIVAFLVMYLAYKNKHNSSMKQYGPIVLVVGITSFFFHQSNFYGSQLTDFAAMFMFVGWAIGMNLIRMGKMKASQLMKFYLIVTAGCLVFMHIMYMTGLKYQGIILLAAFVILGTEIKARKVTPANCKWFVTSIFVFIVAFAFSIADGTRFWCDSTQHGWFSQGHAVWHWIASLGLFTLYLHYAQPALKPQQNCCDHKS